MSKLTQDLKELVALLRCGGSVENQDYKEIYEVISDIEKELAALKEWTAGMYKQLRKCKSCTPDKPQRCTTCDHNFRLRRKGKEDE